MRRPMLLAVLACAGFAGVALAEPVTYKIDPRHTYPSIEADHMGGLSIWRGKIERSEGEIVLDRAAKTGRIEVTMAMASIDFGYEPMNTHVKGPEILEVEKFPDSKFVGQLKDFTSAGEPTAIDGSLTLHGVTRPVRVQITRFKCQANPRNGKEVCGADAQASLQRDEFGIVYGKETGFDMSVKLLISVEAARVDAKP
jgi:polyisoprenoid-binding protein YceI